MSKIYINMSINGYVSVAALATMMAAMSGEGVELSPYPTDDGAKPDPAPAPVATTDKVSTADASPVAAAATDAPTGETDAAGTVFDPSRHTGTKVKSGLWRMKTGMARGAGEGEDSPTYVNPNGSGTGTTTATAGSAPAASAPAATATVVDDEDEFAAFSAAANAGAAPAAAKARTWSDADLSKLNNQAAQKLGSPGPVKAAIAKFVPAGETPHSRNIPADQREAFAQEIEKVAGIEYAG